MDLHQLGHACQTSCKYQHIKPNRPCHHCYTMLPYVIHVNTQYLGLPWYLELQGARSIGSAVPPRTGREDPGPTRSNQVQVLKTSSLGRPPVVPNSFGKGGTTGGRCHVRVQSHLQRYDWRCRASVRSFPSGPSEVRSGEVPHDVQTEKGVRLNHRYLWAPVPSTLNPLYQLQAVT